MLNSLIRFSLAQRALVLALAVVILVFGIRTAREMPVEVLPDLTKPTVTILTEAPGYAPEEVEMLVSTPLESAMMGVTRVSRIRSTSDISLSLVFVEFDWGTDIYQARQFVQERLAGVSESLPDGVTPYMTPVASLMGDIMLIGIRDPSDQTDVRDQRSLADWVVGRRLQAIPGIAEITTMGGGVKQLQVQPNPSEMLAHEVSFEQIRDAAAKAVRNTTGGFLTSGDQEIMVRHLAMTTDLDAIARTVVAYENDRAIRIDDVADVTWGVEPMRGDAGMGTNRGRDEAAGSDPGHAGVILSVRKSPGFDTIKLTVEVEKALDELRQSMPSGVEILTLYRQRDFIDLSIGNLNEALRDGAIMVAITLFLFLFNARVTLITLTAIPLSLGITLIVFDSLGMSVNSMTLGGLAVAIGIVVDDAIVDVENVYRRLRENAASPHPLPRLEVIARASSEVRSSILYATILIILVFCPLMALSGVEGKLFTPIALATIFSMAASFLVSLTIIPVLCSWLLKPKPGKKSHDSIVVKIIKKTFEVTALRLALSQPLLVVMITLTLMVVAGVMFTRMGGNFLPPFKEPTVLVATTTAPGTSLTTTKNIADVALARLLEINGVETAAYRVGRAERGDHVVPVSTMEIDVEFDDYGKEHRDEVVSSIRATMSGIPGTFSVISTPLADRIGHMLSGVAAKVAVKIHGPSLEELQRLGAEVVTLARSIPGLEQARAEQQAAIPQLRIEIDRDRALAYGVTPGEVNEELAALMGGQRVSEVYEGERVHDLVVRLPDDWREDPDRLQQLYIDTKSGQRIPLSYVAEIRQATGPNTILRENTRRRLVVAINPSTNDLNRSVEALEEAVRSELKLPEGYTVTFEGDYQAQQEARKTIIFMSVIIVVVVAFLLFKFFKSHVFVLLVLMNIPLSVMGGILYTRFTLDNISIATLVGFIAISGIAARNDIMMICHYLHLMRHEGEKFDVPMVVRGTLERLVPVLMTAVSAGFALVPLVIAADEPGKEILNPVAIVIVGGLVSSTLLGLLLTPAIFYHYCRRAALQSVALQSAASGGDFQFHLSEDRPIRSAPRPVEA